MGNWAKLCNDILGLIVDQFSTIEDIHNFGAVCRSWRSVSIKKWQLSITDPWLMLVEKEDSDNRGFYSLSTEKVYYLNLPRTRGRKCWSSYGWLITLGLDLEIHLLNPFSRSRVPIRLPPQPTLPHQYSPEVGSEYLRQTFIWKVILSSRPFSLSSTKTTLFEDDDQGKCVVMIIYSQWKKLAFLRIEDEVWTPIDGPYVFDVVYLNGQFYAVASRGKLLIVDISSPHPKTIEFAEPPPNVNVCAKFYLVESGGELFMLARDVIETFGGKEGKEEVEFDDERDEEVEFDDSRDGYCWHIENCICETNGFDVYLFNFDNSKWTQVKSLEKRVMFVGDNSSFAIFPSNHSGCEPNCIYFTDDDPGSLMRRVGGGDDMGLFRMEEDETAYHYDGPNVDILSRICAPLWICPSP